MTKPIDPNLPLALNNDLEKFIKRKGSDIKKFVSTQFSQKASETSNIFMVRLYISGDDSQGYSYNAVKPAYPDGSVVAWFVYSYGYKEKEPHLIYCTAVQKQPNDTKDNFDAVSGSQESDTNYGMRRMLLVYSILEMFAKYYAISLYPSYEDVRDTVSFLDACPDIACLLAAGDGIAETDIKYIVGKASDRNLIRNIVTRSTKISSTGLGTESRKKFISEAPSLCGEKEARACINVYKIELAKFQPVPALPPAVLASITFYDSAINGSLLLRKNATTRINQPEWSCGKTSPADSPAAYTIAALGIPQNRQIRVKFYVLPKTPVTIKASGGGVLGEITALSLPSTDSSPQPVADFLQTISLTPTPASQEINRHDIAWSWKYVGGSTEHDVCVSRHRIYVLFDTPRPPWDIAGPWADMLDRGCTWAQGAKTATELATLITETVNAKLNFRYDTVSGTPAYSKLNYILGSISSAQFNGSGFLGYLDAKDGKPAANPGPIINCLDCATIVSALCNMLGGNQKVAILKGPLGNGFYCNKIISIGYPSWDFPFGAPYALGYGSSKKIGSFSYHAISSVAGTSEIYDACLKVDDSSTPWTWSDALAEDTLRHIPTLPRNMPCLSGTLPPESKPYFARTYRERLAANVPGGIDVCNLAAQVNVTVT
jgi:hypothetical protein